MKWILIGGGVIFIGLMYVLVFSLCKASARRDRLEEAAMRAIRKEKEKEK